MSADAVIVQSASGMSIKPEKGEALFLTGKYLGLGRSKSNPIPDHLRHLRL
jgi:hypothetical protein